MSFKRIAVFLIAFLAMLNSLTVVAQANGEAAAQLARTLKGYETYQADFIQIVVNEDGSKVQETRGALKAKRPGLFYWEASEPLNQFIVSDGDTVSVYDPDLEQVTIHNLDERVSSTPALLLSGEVDNLADTYEVSYRKLGESSEEYTLKPRNPDSLFVSLRLTFFKGELQEMRMADSLAQQSILSFHNIRLNKAVANSAFTLEYPEGVDVIRDGA